jgi:RND family efflux transporter MFP subunit
MNPTEPNKRHHTLMHFSVVLSLWMVGCDKAPSGPQAAPSAPLVTVGKVEELMMIEQEDLSGRVESVESVEIRPRVSGYITEVRFQSGQLVRKGDVLFVIDPRPFRAALQKAKADLDQMRVRQGWAKRDSDRATSMLADKAISQEEADLRSNRLAEASASLSSMEASVSIAELNTEYSEVRSPIDGRVSRALVTLGNNVSGVDGFNTLLTTVVSLDPIYVYSDISEPILRKLQRLGLPRPSSDAGENRLAVRMGLADETGYPHIGWVESIDNRLDSSSGSILLRTQFPNPEGTLTPGLFARLRLPTSENKRVMLVAESAVGTDLSQKYVLTLTSSNTAAYRPVKLGALIEGKRVVREGLSVGEPILINGIQRVRPGSPVTVEASKASMEGGQQTRR